MLFGSLTGQSKKHNWNDRRKDHLILLLNPKTFHSFPGCRMTEKRNCTAPLPVFFSGKCWMTTTPYWLPLDIYCISWMTNRDAGSCWKQQVPIENPIEMPKRYNATEKLFRTWTTSSRQKLMIFIVMLFWPGQKSLKRVCKFSNIGFASDRLPSNWHFNDIRVPILILTIFGYYTRKSCAHKFGDGKRLRLLNMP